MYNEAMRKRIRDQYSPGTRVELIRFANEEQGMPSGLRGTVEYVDDWPQIHVKWDNGRSLALIPGEDLFSKAEQELHGNVLHIHGESRMFSTDGEQSFSGYDNGDGWNGWAFPLFPKESADQIMEYLNHTGAKMSYDAESDSYEVAFSEGDVSDTFRGENYMVNGQQMRLYGIGSHEWTWYEVDQKQTQEGGMTL